VIAPGEPVIPSVRRKLMLVTVLVVGVLLGAPDPAAAVDFNDCIGGGGWVSSWLDETGSWQHFCNGGEHDGESWWTNP